jgi:hypothetical protein
MNNEIDPPAGFTVETGLDTATLTDLIDAMDRAAFRRALELRDTKVERHADSGTND